jgi:STE24 endopeptidase
MSVLSLPLRSAISRRWERSADSFALQATGDADAYRETMLTLARSNLSDVEPPRIVYLLLFTHPTPAERIAAASA